MKKAEVRKLGKASQAKRDLKRPEFRKTLRILDRDAGNNIDLKYKMPTMMKLQVHIIGRTDDITNIETRDLRSHDKFKDFALQMKVSWSKNVLEERDCPDQILLGAADPDFCIILALACWLETRFTENHGNPQFLFGHHAVEQAVPGEQQPDRTAEPDRINGWYQRILQKAWKDSEFQELASAYHGSLGTHSIRKFPATWSAENGCQQHETETRGRWKGKKNGHVVNLYISVEQLPTDAKVAATLCMGGPIKYSIKADSGVTADFIGGEVCPNVQIFLLTTGVTTSLWCWEPHCYGRLWKMVWLTLWHPLFGTGYAQHMKRYVRKSYQQDTIPWRKCH